jgi:hypothetical protein
MSLSLEIMGGVYLREREIASQSSMKSRGYVKTTTNLQGVTRSTALSYSSFSSKLGQ